MNISNHDLADLSGMSKDSAVRILSTFKKEGLINKVKDEVDILDYDALVRIKKTG